MLKDKICIGSGLVCLDILMKGDNAVSYKVGGTCGNVMMILAYMGWESYPIARLNGSDLSRTMIQDMEKNGVHTDYVSTEDNGGLPIITQHNIIDKCGNPTHKFTFEKNKGGIHLDYKPVTKKDAMKIVESLAFEPTIYFFDRVNPATIAMAEYFKTRGTLVFFEPSSIKGNQAQFKKAMEQSDIIKFSDQRVADVDFAGQYEGKLFIQTLGSKGLRFKLFEGEWTALQPIANKNIVDTSGAGDWTTATFLHELVSSGFVTIKDLTGAELKNLLLKAQEKGSESCSYEGARGLMDIKV